MICTCGHHRSSHRPILTKLVYFDFGRCLMDGCYCIQFELVGKLPDFFRVESPDSNTGMGGTE